MYIATSKLSSLFFWKASLNELTGVIGILHIDPGPPVYIVQECAPLGGWKKFSHVEKNGNFTLKKNNI